MLETLSSRFEMLGLEPDELNEHHISVSLSKLNNQQPLACVLLLILAASANSNYCRAFNCPHTDGLLKSACCSQRRHSSFTASVFLRSSSIFTSTHHSVMPSSLPPPPSQHCLSASLFRSLDGGGGPREDGSVQFPVGAGRGGAAGQPAGGLSIVLFHQTGALAGEPHTFADSVFTVSSSMR